MKIYLDGKQIEEPCTATAPDTPNAPGTLTIGDTEISVWVYLGIEDDGGGGTIKVVYCYTEPLGKAANRPATAL